MSIRKEIIEAEFRTNSASKVHQEIAKISNRLHELTDKTKDLKYQQRQLEAQGKKGSVAWKNIREEIRKNDAEVKVLKVDLEKQNGSLKLNEMSTTQLTKKMKQLRSELSRTSKELFPERWEMLNNKLIKVEQQYDKVRHGQKKLQGSMQGIRKTALSFLPTIGIGVFVGMVGKLSKGLFDLAIQMKSDNVRNTTIFGDSLGYINKQAAALHKTMGITRREFVANAAASADLLKPIGFTAEAASKISIRMQKLTGALSEWSRGKYNATEVTEILNSAMTGEMERLKGLGIVIRQDSAEYRNLVKQKMEQQNVSEQQARALATLELMYNKSTDAQNAYAAGGNKLFRFWNGIKAKVREYKENFVSAFMETEQEKLEKQAVLVNSLAVRLTDANTKEEERIAILKQLEGINPKIVKGLSAENIEVAKLKKNMAAYNEEIVNRIILAKMTKEAEESATKLASASMEKGKYQMELEKNLGEASPDIAFENISLEEKYSKIVDQLGGIEKYKELLKEGVNVSRNGMGMVVDIRTKEEQQLVAIVTAMGYLNSAKEKENELQGIYNEHLKEQETLKKILGVKSDPGGNGENGGGSGSNDEVQKKIHLLPLLEIEDEDDLSGELDAYMNRQLDAWGMLDGIKKKFNLTIPEEEKNTALQQLEDYYKDNLLTEEEYLLAKQALNSEFRLEQDQTQLEEELLKAQTDEEKWQAKLELARNRFSQEQLLAGENKKKQLEAELKYKNEVEKVEKAKQKAKLETYIKEKQISLQKVGLMQQTADVIAQIAGQESALGKAAYIWKQGMAIAEVIFNTQIANAKAVAASPLTGGQPWVTYNNIRAGLSVAAIATQAVKGFKVGGFTDKASSDSEAVGVVHANEFVANADAVRNPTVIPILRMIDKAQRDGSISSINFNRISGRGFKSGGFTSENGNDIQYVGYDNSDISEMLQKLNVSVEKLNEQLPNIRAILLYSDLSEMQNKVKLIDDTVNA